MSINLSVPEQHIERELKPRIMVAGVGGAGGNAVNDMIASQLEGVEFLVANTDAQALQGSNAERRIQMGASITHGLGAGAKPDIGRAAAEETLGEIMEHMDGCNMTFIAAGMGGGTGTGAAPVIAQAAREKGILTVGVVTKPFHFEGVHRMRQAEKGIEELEQYVDTLIVIPNQNLFRVANEKTTFADAFRMADEVLYSGVRGVTDLMVMPGMINLDFADIHSVMGEMGKAMMGTGEAEGERRALDAAEAAIANPLLDDCSMKGARGVLINITGGSDMTLFEVDEAANRIRSEVDEEAYIIFGSAFDGDLDGRMRVSVVATGIDAAASKRAAPAVLSAMTERPVSVSSPENTDETESAGDETDEQPLIPFRHLETGSAEESSESEATMPDAPMPTEGAPVTATEEPTSTESVSEESTKEQDDVAAEVEKATEEADSIESVQVSDDSTEAPEERASEPIAARETVSAPEQAPAAMPSASSDDAFIPRAPAVAAGSETPPPSKPFALSDMINGSQEKPSNVAPMSERKTVKSRTGSLIGRIMGSNKPVETPLQPLDWRQNASGSTENTAPINADATAGNSTVEALAKPESPNQTGESPKTGSHTMLGGLNVAERPAPAPVEEDDLLDIPAFLRRQAN